MPRNHPGHIRDMALIRSRALRALQCPGVLVTTTLEFGAPCTWQSEGMDVYVDRGIRVGIIVVPVGCAFSLYTAGIGKEIDGNKQSPKAKRGSITTSLHFFNSKGEST